MSVVASNPGTLNVTMTDADTSYEVTLPRGTTRFTIQCRSANDIRLYSDNGGNYFTIKHTMPPYRERDVVTAGLHTFWLQCAAAGKVAEIRYWT